MSICMCDKLLKIVKDAWYIIYIYCLYIYILGIRLARDCCVILNKTFDYQDSWWASGWMPSSIPIVVKRFPLRLKCSKWNLADHLWQVRTFTTSLPNVSYKFAQAIDPLLPSSGKLTKFQVLNALCSLCSSQLTFAGFWKQLSYIPREVHQITILHMTHSACLFWSEKKNYLHVIKYYRALICFSAFWMRRICFGAHANCCLL